MTLLFLIPLIPWSSATVFFLEANRVPAKFKTEKFID